MVFWAYLLHCRGGAFYAGHTDDLEKRIAQHKSGAVGGFTSDKLPVELVWSQEFPTRYEALTSERQIKGWSRVKKLALIRGEWEAVVRHAKKKGGPSTSSGRTEVGEVSGADVVIAEDAEAAIRAHAAAAHPLECCGLLLGKGDNITAAIPAANVHPSPHTHFEIDPAALIAAHRAARAGGPQVVGYYHSHPHGAPDPSATDRANAAADGRIWAIIGAGIGAGEIRFWRDLQSGFERLSCAAGSG